MLLMNTNGSVTYCVQLVASKAGYCSPAPCPVCDAPGPALGAALSRLEEIWAAQRFAPGAEALLALPEAAP